MFLACRKYVLIKHVVLPLSFILRLRETETMLKGLNEDMKLTSLRGKHIGYWFAIGIATILVLLDSSPTMQICLFY